MPSRSVAHSPLANRNQLSRAPGAATSLPDRRWMALAALDGSGDFTAVSALLAGSVGRSSAELLGSSAFSLLHPADAEGVIERWQRAVSKNRAASISLRFHASNGAWQPAVVRLQPVARRDGSIEMTVLGRIRQTYAAPDSAKSAAVGAPVAAIRWTPGFIVESWSAGARDLFGYEAHEMIGKAALDLISAPAYRRSAASLSGRLEAARCGVREVAHVRTKEGRTFVCEWMHAPILDAGGAIVGFASAASEYAGASRKPIAVERPLRDRLTGLASAALTRDRIDRALARATRDGSEAAVYRIDLDHFAAINDSFGHRGGDALLIAVADRLTRSLREVDTVGRLEGDHFAVLAGGLTGPETVAALARRIVDCFAMPFDAEGHQIFATASVGVAAYPSDGGDADTLFRCAEAAASHAKALGRDTFHICGGLAAAERSTLARDLRFALERGELELHYQPQIDFRSGAIAGAEALIRWKHPRRGLLGPSDFIALAEETGLIIPLGSWVLRAACTAVRSWQEQGIALPRITVNVSGRELRRRLVDDVARVLCDTNVDPSTLELELTETVTMRSSETHPHLLDELKSFGVRLAVDDFGVGYSSLAYLQRFPIDTLKIDRLFVGDCLTNPVDRAIVEAIVAMAHGMSLEVVAEGVETAEQASFLRSLGCDGAQGYLFSRPLPQAEFAALLARAPTYRRFDESAKAG